MIALPIRRWPTRATGASLAPGLVRSTNDLACGGRYPDRTLLLALDPDVARNRVEGRSTDGTGDRMESAGEAFRARLRSGFEAIAASEPGSRPTSSMPRAVSTKCTDVFAPTSPICLT